MKFSVRAQTFQLVALLFMAIAPRDRVIIASNLMEREDSGDAAAANNEFLNGIACYASLGFDRYATCTE